MDMNQFKSNFIKVVIVASNLVRIMEFLIKHHDSIMSAIGSIPWYP
jgi:hypothetical protein